MIRPLAAALAAALGLAAPAFAQFGPLTNGSLDPFNKNNSLGGSIKTPIQKPRLPGSAPADQGSQLSVQSYQLDADGNFVEVSPYGNRTSTGKRGTLLRDAKTGKAFWELTSGGQRYTCFAAAKWQAVLDAKEKPPQQPLAPAARTLFRIESSQFESRGGGKWVERRDAGQDSTFTEAKRTSEYIELYDAARKMSVRLYDDRGLFYNADGRWVPWVGSNGRWTK